MKIFVLTAVLGIFTISCGRLSSNAPNIEFNSEYEVKQYLDSIRQVLFIIDGVEEQAASFARVTCDCIDMLDWKFLDVPKPDYYKKMAGKLERDNAYGALDQLHYQVYIMIEQKLINGKGFGGSYNRYQLIDKYIESFCPEEAKRAIEIYKRHSLF